MKSPASDPVSKRILTRSAAWRRYSWVLGKILLDTGSLAGDFISHDLLTLTRLKGQHFVYKTAIYLAICTIIFIITPFLPHAHTIPSLSYGLSCFPRQLLRLPACCYFYFYFQQCYSCSCPLRSQLYASQPCAL